MPTVSDFNTVVGSSSSVAIGDDGVQVWEETFGTGGRSLGQQDAHLLVEFYGLAGGNSAEVLINNDKVGSLKGYTGEEYGDEKRHTQMISFLDEHLNNGTNEVQINAVESQSDDGFDDFVIENMVCMFHQEA